jgi:hypothetical protein
MDENNNDGTVQSHHERVLAVLHNDRQEDPPSDFPPVESMSMEELDALPLPPEAAGKPHSYFEDIVRNVAQEAAAKLPEGDIPPLVRSALNAGLPPQTERTNGGQIRTGSTKPIWEWAQTSSPTVH